MSENRKYTPGPWCAWVPVNDPWHPRVYADNAEKTDICHVDMSDGWETAVANTLLIAAAPEMRELLEDISETLATHCRISEFDCPQWQARIDGVLWESDPERISASRPQGSIWHPAEEEPEFEDEWAHIVILRDGDRKIDSFQFHREMGWQLQVTMRHIRKWAFMGALEALG